jgi:uncharacterized membrane protein
VARKDNLSKPRGSGGGTGYDSDAFARGAESVARFLGTGRYLAVQTIFVVFWIATNAFLALDQGRKHAFDPYPFILLNLVFSTQAAYAAPLILLAQNRQADRDKEVVERDRDTNARALAETEYLARQLAEVLIVLEHKADREDLMAPLEQLTHAIERLQGVSLLEDEDAEADAAN